MILHFGDCELDSDRRELRVGTGPVHVEPQVFDLLSYLIANRDRVIGKDELVEAVWHGRIVSDVTLNSRINAARRAIGDNGQVQSFIRTLPRKGVRFIGLVQEVQRPAAEPAKADNAEQPLVIAVESIPSAVRQASERRQLTILSAELLGWARLASHRDPEDLVDLLGAYHRCVVETVAPFGGIVGRGAGTTISVLFGYPAAHEDDAEQAVRAGLELCTAVGALKPDAGSTWHCRVGIATGVVVIGNRADEAPQAEPVGEAVNMVARLQMLAPPGAVIIEESTKRLIGNLFDCRDLGALDMTGTGDAARVWQVLAPSMAESRFEALHAGSLTPLIGRDEELEMLLRRWRQGTQGEGRVVLITGEPGIGKSRLALALQDALHTEPHTRLRYFCSPHRTDSSLFPFITQLKRAAGFERDDATAQKLAKLETLLGQASTDPESVALVADLLSLPGDTRTALPDLTPQKRKQKTLAALLTQLEGLAGQQPVLIVFEDLHWIDPTSLELLAMTVERIRTLPVLMVVTFRPEFQPPWTGQPNVTTVSLSRLGMREGTALVQHVSGDKILPRQIINEIVQRTDGIPLFLEEMTRAVLESSGDEIELQNMISAHPPVALALPATLHASLMARLDRLGPAKQVAQIGAAIGREFSYELITALALASDTELSSALDRLVESGLVFRRGLHPQATYQFKHVLIRDAAYGTLLREPRRELHARIAQALTEKFPEVTETQPEILAHHYTEAGQRPSIGARLATNRSSTLRWLKLLRSSPKHWSRSPAFLALPHCEPSRSNFSSLGPACSCMSKVIPHPKCRQHSKRPEP
jgi:class 3 adenylate cyclase